LRKGYSATIALNSLVDLTAAIAGWVAAIFGMHTDRVICSRNMQKIPASSLRAQRSNPALSFAEALDCFAALAMTGKSRWLESSARIRPLELAQQAVAALDGGVERGLRGLLAGEHMFEFFLDHAADQDEGAEADAPGIFGRRLQGQLLDPDRRAGIAIVEAL